MTLSSSPTFILIDTAAHTFALKIVLPPKSVDETQYMGGFDASKFKKGHVVVVRNPVRNIKEGKEGAGFVSAGVEDVSVSLVDSLWCEGRKNAKCTQEE